MPLRLFFGVKTCEHRDQRKKEKPRRREREEEAGREREGGRERHLFVSNLIISFYFGNPWESRYNQ